jgi:hypothetical protein
MKGHRLARTCYAVMYFAASLINTLLALRSPEVLRGLATTAYFPILRHLLSEAPVYLFVAALLAFAGYQITLGLLLLHPRRYRLGLWGGLAFHLAIIPFGPFNLLNLPIALPLAVVLRDRRPAAATATTGRS